MDFQGKLSELHLVRGVSKIQRVNHIVLVPVFNWYDTPLPWSPPMTVELPFIYPWHIPIQRVDKVITPQLIKLLLMRVHLEAL